MKKFSIFTAICLLAMMTIACNKDKTVDETAIDSLSNTETSATTGGEATGTEGNGTSTDKTQNDNTDKNTKYSILEDANVLEETKLLITETANNDGIWSAWYQDPTGKVGGRLARVFIFNEDGTFYYASCTSMTGALNKAKGITNGGADQARGTFEVNDDAKLIFKYTGGKEDSNVFTRDYYVKQKSDGTFYFGYRTSINDKLDFYKGLQN